MTDIVASVDHIRWCGDEFARSADGLAAVDGADTAAAVAALGPVFGVLGGDFLPAFGAAHAAHSEGVAGLEAVLRGAGATAHAIAQAYAQHESAHSDALSASAAAL
ncbi:MAG: ESX-1 secretion-associated protein [Tomitella sp.]|nr:ESX-1 secretion-associated protein [Tomitella sp.]